MTIQGPVSSPHSGSTIERDSKPTIDALGTPYHALSWTSADGLRLAARDYGDLGSARPPLVCLAGLTRNARDFEPLAAHLVPLGYRLIAPDSRGRGRSDWDPSPERYIPKIELDDALTLIDGLGITRVSLFGTSRGGLLAMLAATARPGFIDRTILNDIGPQIELGGLLKIKNYVGRDLGDMTWEQGVFALSISLGKSYPRLDHAGWTRYARRLWRDQGGKPVNDYDPAIGLGFAGITEATKLYEPWDEFAALAEAPILVLRGSLSDILSAEGVAEMQRRFPAVESLEVPDEAHVPLLEDSLTLDRITAFLNG